MHHTEPRLQFQKGSPFLYADFSFYDPSKQRWVRKFVSTKCREGEEKRAMAIARELASAARKVSENAMHGWSQLRIESIVSDLASATGIPLLSLQRKSWLTVFNDFIGSLPSDLSIAGRQRYGLARDELSELLGPSMKNAPLQAITVAHLERYFASLCERFKAGTAIARFAPIRTIFKRAFDEGLITMNPAALVSTRGLAHDVESRQPFTADQLTKIAAACRSWEGLGAGEWTTMFLLGMCLGARLGDCMAMTLDHFKKVKTGWICDYVPAKTKRKGKALQVPVVEPLASHLDELLPRSTGYLCPQLAALKNTAPASREFVAILDSCGINEQAAKGNKQRRVRTASFHSLRHTLPTFLLAAGVDEVTRMRIVGHASTKMSRLYSHSDMEQLRDALTRGLAPLSAVARPPSSKRGSGRRHKLGDER